MYTITAKDLKMTRSHDISPQIKVDIYSLQDKYIDTIMGGLVDGSMNITAESDVRRTTTFNFIPTKKFDTKIADGKYIWMDKYVYLSIGFYDEVRDEYLWYKQGKYIFTDASISYSATTNQITVNASDLMSKLNGTVNGELGQQIIQFPAYEKVEATIFSRTDTTYANNIFKANVDGYSKYTDGDMIAVTVSDVNQYGCSLQINNLKAFPIVNFANGRIEEKTFARLETYVFKYVENMQHFLYVGQHGQPTEYNTIRSAVVTTISQLGGIDKSMIEVDDIGEYQAMQQKNPSGWQDRRKENPYWANIPYDLEFSAGSTVLSIIQDLVSLYPDYETFFDEESKFRVQMIPDCKYDETMFKNGFLNKVLIDENTTIDFTPVRNVTEVWGKVLDGVDFFANEGVTYSSSTYSANINGYDQYYNGDLIGLRIPTTNSANSKININGYGAYLIYDENTENPIDANKLQPDQVYVFKVKKHREDKSDIIKIYLLGQWQPHAICVLTDGTVGEDYTLPSGKVVKKYSKSYFKEMYNCETVGFTVIPDSPFTVQALGEVRLKVFTGGEFDNIMSDSLALSRAEFELYKLARLTDNITINVKYMPYMDVNIKVQYKGINDEFPKEYICKTVAHNFANGTTALTLMRFYETYIPEDYPDLIE